MRKHINRLSERQKKVLEQFSQGIKMREIAENLNVSEDIIRGDIRTIRVIIKREMALDSKEEQQIFENVY